MQQKSFNPYHHRNKILARFEDWKARRVVAGTWTTILSYRVVDALLDIIKSVAQEENGDSGNHCDPYTITFGDLWQYHEAAEDAYEKLRTTWFRSSVWMSPFNDGIPAIQWNEPTPEEVVRTIVTAIAEAISHEQYHKRFEVQSTTE